MNNPIVLHAMVAPAVVTLPDGKWFDKSKAMCYSGLHDSCCELFNTHVGGWVMHTWQMSMASAEYRHTYTKIQPFDAWAWLIHNRHFHVVPRHYLDSMEI